MTLLSIAQEVSARLQLPTPATVINNTSNNVALVKTMIQRAVQELRNEFPWPELQKEYYFYTLANCSAYRLPSDFNRFMMESLWNKDQRWPLLGPTDAIQWQTYKSGLVTSLPRQRYRVKGWSNSQFFLDPTPSAYEKIIFEYISQSPIRPASWVSNTAYALNTYVSSDGLILKCTTNGTSANSVQAPEFGRDGTVFWSSVPAYVVNGDYYVGQLVYANSNVYKCTVAGKGGAAPAHGSGSATTGTCTFLFISTPAAWVAGTAYSAGDYSVNGTDCYTALEGGTSGLNAPKFRKVLGATGVPDAATTDTITDGTCVWTVQYSAFETFQADTDEVLLEPQLIIDGAVWRFKQERGFDFEDLRQQALQGVELAKSRKQSASVLSISRNARLPAMIGWWSYPEGNYGL